MRAGAAESVFQRLSSALFGILTPLASSHLTAVIATRGHRHRIIVPSRGSQHIERPGEFPLPSCA
jgi:hypothetical protein